MAKPIKLSPEEYAIAVAAVALFANYLSGIVFGYPFLYCWTLPVVFPVYMAWGGFCIYIAVAYGIFLLCRGNMLGVMATAAICVIVIEMPRLATYILNSGGSCHG